MVAPKTQRVASFIYSNIVAEIFSGYNWITVGLLRKERPMEEDSVTVKLTWLIGYRLNGSVTAIV